MLTAVAGSEPYRLFALVDEPLWCVLYVYHHLDDRETRDALVARVLRVESGILAGMGLNNPPALADEMRKAQDAIDEYERGPDDRAGDLATLRAAGEALAARMERGRVLSPEALVS